MTIREYFDRMIDEDYDLNEIAELEQTTFRCMEEDFDDFAMWAIENGIDLNARDKDMDETVLTLWAWDVCGD
jgi:hypothetical protein